MSPLGFPSSWTRFFQEFHCRECGNDEAYRSRPRGPERAFLPLLMLKPVRCDRCYHRSYIFRGVPVLEHVGSATKPSSKQHPSTSDTGTRVA